MEIGFSRVYVESCSSQSEAMILLTNYRYWTVISGPLIFVFRIIILSVGDMKGNKMTSSANLSSLTTASNVS